MEWRKIYDLEVSENGDVRNPSRHKVSFYIDTIGYPTTTAKIDGFVRRQKVRIHRLVAMAFIDNPNNHKEVNHIDGNKANNNVSNLEWCTHSQNIFHAFRTMNKKGNHSRTKLNEHQVQEIYKMAIVYGLQHKLIAALYGISRPHVTEICSRKKCWFNVDFQLTL